MISAPLIEYLKKGIFTFLGIILAVYLFVILSTYTGNDPSWSHISSDMTTINNMGGSTGAWLSDLFYSFFGFGAWWLLAFLIYESILIWWDNKPTFWLLRLVAYVFLILSSSALFAQIIALVQQVTDPIASGLEGVAGGIIGLELQARLTQLLSQWGSVLFLAGFVGITATFAFNIHWHKLYRKFTDLSWLGSGVKDNSDQHDYSQQSSHNLASNDEENSAAQNLAASTNNNTSAEHRAKQSANDYEQLPLELQTAGVSHAPDNSSRFSYALTDFLTKSGLRASVKATVAADAAESATSQATLYDNSQASAPVSNNHTENTNNKTQAVAPTMPTRKVEPSFAWNDAGTVDDLLATEAEKYQCVSTSTAAVDPVISTPVETHVDFEQAAEYDDTAFEDNQSNAIKSEQTDTIVADEQTPNLDELADNWLAENEPVNVDIAPSFEPMTSFDKGATDHLEPINDATKRAEHQASPVVEDQPIVEERVTKTDNVDAKRQLNVQEPMISKDMTPTNTPPANPKPAPKAEPAVESVNSSINAEPLAGSKPTMSFAVPEGDSSNHITDMMPEDDSRLDDPDAPVMPDISDDAAFSRKSRSMQTAQYRAQLSPIPELSILDKPDPDRKPSYTIQELEQLSELLEIKLQEFNVKASVVNAIPGPVVTRFEVDLAAGVKASKVTGISRDLARSLSMASLRVVEVIPGKPYIGIEVPNKKREMVRLIELLNTEKYKDPKAQISMAMGKDIGGNPIITDLARAPHMLVAGTTGSGKSVLVNSMLLSMLLKYTPNDLRLILIDPKQLELANYNDIPHLLTPVVTDMTEAASSLSWCVAEMERRYQLMSLLKVRKLNEFNKKVIAAEKAGKPMLDPLWRPNDSVSIDQAPKLKTLPMIVIVADEFADMIMQVGKQAEELITRLAQKSRAAGIHLMLATQRPSVDVITGLIKANIPVRAALRVNSKVDSRTILDSGGAEDMLGNGDMLFLGPGQIEPDRVHGAYVSDEEVNRVCDAWRERGAPDYIDNMAGNFELSSPGGSSTGSASGEDDDLYNDAVAFIMETRKVSASSIQRKFSIGYNRAARIVDSMEEAGLVSSMGKSGKRELLM
ncbi:DNA translocase FtsK [Psychrobacter sp. Cmf 22.2]|uniref:DNA translocase FtsK n=1 Tax=Psychrobacter sp. Cmf 22.2 TaxID=1926478 RepID=UPI000946CAD4|nr:DNA translocase FtsK 4TM domain-containing protein [Psychrobacter sp. Cmf 22.2]OLF35958.1 cell division protein FtsK [Psychrobacter sp. Cmf 22.2]